MGGNAWEEVETCDWDEGSADVAVDHWAERVIVTVVENEGEKWKMDSAGREEKVEMERGRVGGIS